MDFDEYHLYFQTYILNIHLLELNFHSFFYFRNLDLMNHRSIHFIFHHNFVLKIHFLLLFLNHLQSNNYFHFFSTLKNKNELIKCLNEVQENSKLKKYFNEIINEMNKHHLKENYLFFEYKGLIENALKKIENEKINMNLNSSFLSNINY